MTGLRLSLTACHVLAGLAAWTASPLLSGDGGPTAPSLKLRPVAPESVRWNGGFWGTRFDLCGSAVLPGIWEVMQMPDNAATFHDLRKAAGLTPPGKPGGRKWSDGDCHKCIETMAHLHEVAPDPALACQMEEAISWVAGAQCEDGYLSSWVQLSGVDRWSDLNNHELYNMGHLMTAASVHHRVTGKRNYLDIAIRTGNYLHDLFMPRPRALAHFGFNPSNIMGAIDLFRATGDRRYLDLAGVFVDMRGSVPGGSNQNQAAVPLRKETEAVGHVVTATYLWCGAADLCAETGEPALLDALQSLWEDVTTRKMYVTGGAAALHFGEVTRKTFNRWPRDSVHEAFGAPFQLPNRTAYNETCANIGTAMWAWRMLGLTGESRYADVMERVLYNSVLSAMHLDGTRFFYTNPLRRGDDTVPLMSNDALERWRDTTPTSPVQCYCCPPNVARTLAGLHGWAYGVGENTLWVNLYGCSTVQTDLGGGRRIALAQETRYPWGGRVSLKVREAPDDPAGIALRIPGWTDAARVAINGAPADASPTPGSFLELHRSWSAGDAIELNLGMDVAFLEANPLIEEARNQVAVMRGPLVYCLESTDLPPGTNIDAVSIDTGGDWAARWSPDLLGGVMTVTGPGVVASSPDWSDRELYRRLEAHTAAVISVRLIPYYAWANRGRSEMTVWLQSAATRPGFTERR